MLPASAGSRNKHLATLFPLAYVLVLQAVLPKPLSLADSFSVIALGFPHVVAAVKHNNVCMLHGHISQDVA